MQNLRDIQNRNDIELFVRAFYEKALADDTIGYIFTDVVKITREHHIPLICDFWETTLFHKPIYKGNPLQVHLDLNFKEPLQPVHFDKWLELFNNTLDSLYKGEKVELAKTRALSMATVMRIKLSAPN